MRSKTNRIGWLLCVLFLAWPAQAQYGGGMGEPNDPYLIYTAEQMNTIGANCGDLDKHFRLMADIDLSGVSGTDFNMIGIGPGCAFSGVFDGNGHTISNFTCTYPDRGFPTGLFGYVQDSEARITNLGLIDPNVDAGQGTIVGSLVGLVDAGTVMNCYVEGGSVSADRCVGGLVGYNAGIVRDCHSASNVSGYEYVGGLMGRNEGSIINCSALGAVSGGDEVGGLVGDNDASIISCYTAGSVSGSDEVGGIVGSNSGPIANCSAGAGVSGGNRVGGLVGRNRPGGEIVNCYANSQALGQNFVGGLVGENSSSRSRAGEPLSHAIRNCYSTTAVSGDEQIGGLVGHNKGSKVGYSFWDVETSGQPGSDGGTGKTTVEMWDPNTFIDAGWRFVGATRTQCDVWAEPDGGGYPILWWQLLTLPEPPAFSGGTGEPDYPYLISTSDELSSIGPDPELMTAHFKLIEDIDLVDVDFCIISSQFYPFRGTFDGDGHVISNLSRTSTDPDCAGLFQYVAGGEIKNLRLIGPHLEVADGNHHGLLVGRLEAGTVTHCYVQDGSIVGGDGVGGLVGENGSAGIIVDCSCTADVAGTDKVGGLVGANLGTITNCSTTGSVGAKNDVGGLVGNNSGIIVSSYSDAGVEGENAVGGLVGRNSPGEIVDCYAWGSVAGKWYIGGLVGSNSGRTGRLPGTICNCYSITAVLEGSQSGGLIGANWGGEVSGCFWDIETSGRTNGYGGTGKTTADMQNAETFLNAGWDFVNEIENGTEDIWCICQESGYPTLAWRSERSDSRSCGL